MACEYRIIIFVGNMFTASKGDLLPMIVTEIYGVYRILIWFNRITQKQAIVGVSLHYILLAMNHIGGFDAALPMSSHILNCQKV